MTKDVGIRYVEIVPSDTVLDFIGHEIPDRSMAHCRSEDDDDCNDTYESDSITLKGEALFSLSRPLKIRSMTVKLKGVSSTSFQSNILESPILPKLKQALFGKMTLPAGDHVIPFLLQVPNIYPPSLKTKRASIAYKIELSMAIGLQKKCITAEHPILIHRHQLRSVEMAPLVETQVYQNTIPARFHYEIDAPQVVCVEQAAIPVSVRYLCFATQKPVRRIRTQLKQIELYSSDCKHVNRKLQYMLGEHSVTSSSRNHKRYIKRTIPALFHAVDTEFERSTWNQPLLVRHKMQKVEVTPSFESPLISVCHELEITFQFEHQFEDIKAKIPVVIASIPQGNRDLSTLQPISRVPKYPFETGRAHQECRVSGVDHIRHDRLQHFSDAAVVKHSLDEDRLRINNERAVANSDSGMRKFPSFNDLDTLSPTSHRRGNDIGYVEEGIKEAEQVSPYMCNKMRFAQHRKQGATGIHEKRKQQPLRPIDINLANGVKAPVSKHSVSSTTKQPRKKNQQKRAAIGRIVDSAQTDFSQDHTTLKSRPPSVVYSSAPGLPAATELRPQTALQTSLLEESFIEDEDTERGRRSPDLATIASSTLMLSPRTVIAPDLPFPRDGGMMTKGEGVDMPAQPPPPQAPLPPLPHLRPFGLDDNSRTHDRDPIPRPTRRQQHQKLTYVDYQYRRQTKLYIEDSDDEAVDPLPSLL